MNINNVFVIKSHLILKVQERYINKKVYFKLKKECCI